MSWALVFLILVLLVSETGDKILLVQHPILNFLPPKIFTVGRKSIPDAASHLEVESMKYPGTFFSLVFSLFS